MARIRTIKPEFPQSESMGRVSRDARLLFVQLWTICDDSGRTRGASRMLASLLFPYDEDAGGLIDGWLTELEREGCLVRYEVDGSTYLQVQKWQQHQKIDKPSASKFPAPRESSRDFAEPSRKIVQDQGPRTKDQGRDQGEEAREPVRATRSDVNRPASRPKKPERGTRWPADAIVPDDWQNAAADARDRAGLGPVDMRHEVVKFSHYWASPDARNPVKKDWRQTFINWILNSKGTANGPGKPTGQHGQSSAAGEIFGRLYANARAKRETAGD